MTPTITPDNIDRLDRFVNAQADVWHSIIEELRLGKKASHWMWFVFPQLRSLGRTPTAHYFGLADVTEANRYLEHEILGARLRECCGILLSSTNSDAFQILGAPDNLKFQSSMTLFSQCDCSDVIYSEVLGKFFNEQFDEETIRIINLE